MSETTFRISIPTDNEGLILLQCNHCGEYFKISASDCEDDGILNLVCPACGLISDTYLTEDVISLALAMITNYAMDSIYDAFKDLERHNNKGPVTFKAGKKPKHEPENPIHSGIQALEKAEFPCCQRLAKIKPLLKITGCYCPFCGVKTFDFEQN